MTGDMLPPIAAPRKRRSERLTAGLVLAATLLVGILLGVALDRSILLSRLHPPGGPPRGGFQGSLRALEFGGRPDDVRRVRNRMKEQLSLTEEQANKIDSIMARRSAAFRTIREETETRVKVMVDSTRTMIDSVLTPAQRVKAHELRARRERERRAQDGK